MPDELLKFRCYRCNQLLAVAPSRAGKIVNCPKCKAELQIPALEPAATVDASAAPATEAGRRRRREPGEGSDIVPAQPQAQALPSFLEGVAAIIPPEVAELRPEDLRVEAHVLESLPRRSGFNASPSAPASAHGPDSSGALPMIEFPEATAEWPSAEELSNAFAAPPAEVRQPPPVPPIELMSLPPAEKAPSVAPPIEIEAPPALKDDRPMRHVREVAVPAAVLLAWSLFGLVGLAFSFIAGLMIGHFVWKLP
jgi:phage FluMu protein Com